MSEKSEADEFEDEDDDEPADEEAEEEEVDLDQVIKDLDQAKRRGQKLGDPAWRRLERLLEEKRTHELTRDFPDYDIGEDGRPPRISPGTRGMASSSSSGHSPQRRKR